MSGLSETSKNKNIYKLKTNSKSSDGSFANIFVPTSNSGAKSDQIPGFYMSQNSFDDVISRILEPILETAVKRGLMARLLQCDVSNEAISNATRFKPNNVKTDRLRENLSRLKLPKRHILLQKLSKATTSLNNTSNINKIQTTNATDPSTQLALAAPVDSSLVSRAKSFQERAVLSVSSPVAGANSGAVASSSSSSSSNNNSVSKSFSPVSVKKNTNLSHTHPAMWLTDLADRVSSHRLASRYALGFTERHLVQETERYNELTDIVSNGQAQLKNNVKHTKHANQLIELKKKLPKIATQLETAEKVEHKAEERLRKAKLAHSVAVRKRREVQAKRHTVNGEIQTLKRAMGTVILKLQASLIESKKLYRESELNLEMLHGFKYYQELIDELVEQQQLVGTEIFPSSSTSSATATVTDDNSVPSSTSLSAASSTASSSSSSSSALTTTPLMSVLEQANRHIDTLMETSNLKEQAEQCRMILLSLSLLKRSWFQPPVGIHMRSRAPSLGRSPSIGQQHGYLNTSRSQVIVAQGHDSSLRAMDDLERKLSEKVASYKGTVADTALTATNAGGSATNCNVASTVVLYHAGTFKR